MQAAALPSPIISVPNVTAHTSMASVPITVLLYDGPLLCGFNVAIKGLIWQCLAPSWTASMGRRPATMAVGQHAVRPGESIYVPSWARLQAGKSIPVQK